MHIDVDNVNPVSYAKYLNEGPSIHLSTLLNDSSIYSLE